jgi:hypothetical protein
VSVVFHIHNPIGMGPIISSVACLAVHSYSTLYGTIFGKILFNLKYDLLFLTNLSETFLILKIIKRNMTINVRKIFM